MKTSESRDKFPHFKEKSQLQKDYAGATSFLLLIVNLGKLLSIM